MNLPSTKFFFLHAVAKNVDCSTMRDLLHALSLEEKFSKWWNYPEQKIKSHLFFYWVREICTLRRNQLEARTTGPSWESPGVEWAWARAARGSSRWHPVCLWQQVCWLDYGDIEELVFNVYHQKVQRYPHGGAPCPVEAFCYYLH